LENYKQLYVITKVAKEKSDEEEGEEFKEDADGQVNLYGFSRKKLYIFNTLVKKMQADTTVIPFFAPAEHPQFILFNTESGYLRVHEHYW